MIELRLEIGDLADTRLAISPLLETALSLRMWHFPGYYILQLPWLRQARRDLDGLDIGLLLDLVGLRQRTVPDFLLPRPDDPVPDFAAELDRTRSTKPAKVAEDIATAHDGIPLPPTLQTALRRPARLRDQIVELLAAYWERTIAPHWPRIRGVLEADLLYRAQQMARGGHRLLFADLDPMMSWSDGRLEVQPPIPHTDTSIRVNGRGLCLIPAIFVNTPCPPINAEGPPMVVYPARGSATVWESTPPPPPQALQALLGRPKATILTLLEHPTSTTGLSRRMGVTPGAVSQHLAILRATGLVSRAPAGRTTLYTRTALAAALLSRPDPPTPWT
jgi:DNA-binding transcriptional ArsR family regulator